MDIESKDLLKILADISDKLKADNIKKFSVDTDYYWKVSAEDSIQMDKEPVLAVGSLKDDWNNISKVISGKQVLTSVDFERVASVLILISEKLAR
jgi:hypothetical protein